MSWQFKTLLHKVFFLSVSATATDDFALLSLNMIHNLNSWVHISFIHGNLFSKLKSILINIFLLFQFITLNSHVNLLTLDSILSLVWYDLKPKNSRNELEWNTWFGDSNWSSIKKNDAVKYIWFRRRITFYK